MDATSELPPPALTRRPWQFSLARLFVWIAVTGLFFGVVSWFWRSIQLARDNARGSACRGNLKQLVVALHSYHDVHGTFPPAYIPDARGQPMHSWRVLILPYIEERVLYDSYDFSQPWNAPVNLQLTQQMPLTFHCPHCEAWRGKGMTNYVAVVGPGTAWPRDRGSQLPEFTDGTEQTLLIVETHGSQICWLDPRDLEFSKLPLEINPRGQPGICSPHPGGANVALADGSIPTLSPAEMTPERLKAMLTIAGEDGPDR